MPVTAPCWASMPVNGASSIEKIIHQEILEIKETNLETITMAVLEESKEIKIHLQEISIIKGTTILEILETKEVSQKTTTMAVSEEKPLKETKEMKREVMQEQVSEVKVTLILTIEATEILETEATEMVAEIEVSDNIH